MTVSNSEYLNEKRAFLNRHDWISTDTSPVDEYGVYHKEYVCSDGAVWYEVMSPEYVKTVASVKGCSVEIKVKMFRTEFWSSSNAASKFYYEKF